MSIEMCKLMIHLTDYVTPTIQSILLYENGGPIASNVHNLAHSTVHMVTFQWESTLLHQMTCLDGLLHMTM